ncbi:MAG: PspA/IM30 family protein [Alphaproteobacteria bacterium]|nr:PspA/IM30 family protein [Alphaproteobacteria bacterium]MCB9692295.1 PspA/IM30 family protein [Alphaproteobacteria bacterium]
MGFFDRLANVWRGFLSLWVSDIEARNPEAVYEAAIDERVKKHRELKKAVSGIVYLRNKLSTELETKERELKDVMAQLPVAVEDGEDEVALLLIQKKDELTASIEATSAELKKVSDQAEDAKAGLLQFQGEIEKLKREKEKAIAAKANAEARIEIQQTLDGLSTDADVKALDNVREHIQKLQAEADIGSELKGDSLDAKLSKIKEKANNASARAQLAAMKQQMAGRATEGGPKNL